MFFDNNELYLEIEATHIPSSDTLKGVSNRGVQLPPDQ